MLKIIKDAIETTKFSLVCCSDDYWKSLKTNLDHTYKCNTDEIVFNGGKSMVMRIRDNGLKIYGVRFDSTRPTLAILPATAQGNIKLNRELSLVMHPLNRTILFTSEV